MKIYLLAPNYCWHTRDLIDLKNFSNELNYFFLADTPPFLSRRVFKKYFSNINLSYEFVQRIWRIGFCIPWSLYLRFRLSNNNLLHCHGLFALIMSHIAGISNSRIIFTPQGSDLLVLPNKNNVIKKFLSKKLHKLAFITADSDLLLKKAIEIAPNIDYKKLQVIQNGIPLKEIEKINNNKSKFSERSIDICWIRGLTSIYKFDYFLEILKFLSKISNKEINVAIISSYGLNVIPDEIYNLQNLKIKLLPRLSKKEFLKCLFNSKIVVSIPESDSSPRSVYEAINLGCKLFVSKLNCFDWLPNKIKSEFIFSKNFIEDDSKILLNAINNFNEININFKSNYPHFYKSLDYEYIAESYLKIFKRLNELD